MEHNNLNADSPNQLKQIKKLTKLTIHEDDPLTL
jgi:hypothetical protein